LCHCSGSRVVAVRGNEDGAGYVAVNAVAICVLKRVIRIIRAKCHVAKKPEERGGVRRRDGDITDCAGSGGRLRYVRPRIGGLQRACLLKNKIRRRCRPLDPNVSTFPSDHEPIGGRRRRARGWNGQRGNP
jgi:hypothetical protein